jgi:hypothetical protein
VAGTSVTPTPLFTWLPSVAPIDESYIVDFLVSRGGDDVSRMRGELAWKSQMTEKWNEETFGTGGRGLNMSTLRENEDEG